MNISVTSETGRLQTVLLHRPGKEIERVTPANVERALYSDILNLSIVTEEYSQLEGVLAVTSTVLQLTQLLGEALTDAQAREKLIETLCRPPEMRYLAGYLKSLPTDMLVNQIIEGIEIKRDNLTRFLSPESYSLPPLHNFFFIRDAGFVIGNEFFVSRMANQGREREALIMETIFRFHPQLRAEVVRLHEHCHSPHAMTIEGGDILVVAPDMLLVGNGVRTSTHAIDALIDHFKQKNDKEYHILVQELPSHPESFIHLDMVFTLPGNGKCMIYEPLLASRARWRTIVITVWGNHVRIREQENLLTALDSLGFYVEPVFCGGTFDPRVQEREQWHSGANFFTLAPGIVVGYERNTHTIDELFRHGFEVVRAHDFIEQGQMPAEGRNMVITLEGSELPRGGGGARCMTMPLCRL